MNSVSMTAKEAYELWQKEGDSVSPEVKQIAQVYEKLEKNKTGRVKCTVENLEAIMAEDPNLLCNVRYDLFSGWYYVVGSLPWERGDCLEWQKTDDISLQMYVEKNYKIFPSTKAYKVAFNAVMSREEQSFDRALEFVTRGKWDGVPRAEALLVDTLGVDDNELNRQMTLLWLKAVVARQFNPGTPFENMLVLSGAGGIGKTFFVELIASEKFYNSYVPVKGSKDVMFESIWGKMIIEPQPPFYDKRHRDNLRNWLKKEGDYYRIIYEKAEKYYPRRCIYVYTTNNIELLNKREDNSQFWTMLCHERKIVTHSWDLLTPDYVEQVWAEACVKYKEDPNLSLSDELKEQLKVVQEEFMM